MHYTGDSTCDTATVCGRIVREYYSDSYRVDWGTTRQPIASTILDLNALLEDTYRHIVPASDAANPMRGAGSIWRDCSAGSNARMGGCWPN